MSNSTTTCSLSEFASAIRAIEQDPTDQAAWKTFYQHLTNENLKTCLPQLTM
jgi:hypothetical protein